jgi:hypothetical protein
MWHARNCLVCDAVFHVDRPAKPQRCCSQKCAGVLLRGPNNPNWKGGQFVSGGRVHFNLGGGSSITRARKLMQEHLGRELGRDEVVHHINGDKMDDRGNREAA